MCRTAAWVVVILVGLVSSLSGQLTPFGCPRAHCDAANSDLARVPVPGPGAHEVWHRTELPGEQAGSLTGLDCSSNTVIAACSYAGPSSNVAAYDFDGNRLWDSGATLAATAFASAPIVLVDGSVIAADGAVLVRFNRLGSIVWQAPLPYGGIPISPVLTEDGTVVVLATLGGPIYAFDIVSGAPAGLLFIRRTPNDPGFFETAPTVLAVRDLGPAPLLLWKRPAGGFVRASFARDPRPGVATFWIPDFDGLYITGQFPLLLRGGRPRVVFTSFNSGALAAPRSPST